VPVVLQRSESEPESVTYSRRKRAQKSGRLTRFQANAVYVVALICGLASALSFLVPAPPLLLTALNAPAALGCFYLGIAASSVVGKALCVAWALAVGGWVRESRSRVVLAGVGAAHCLALGGLVRALVH
jgi:hypothetical protein